MQSYIQRKVSQCAQNVKGRDMRMKGFDEGKIYTIKKVNDVSASFKCTQKRYLSQRYRLLRGGGTVYFCYSGNIDCDISGITRKSSAKNRIGEADFLMRQQRSRFHLPYIPECTLYAQAQTRSEYTDPPPIPPARSHLS